MSELCLANGRIARVAVVARQQGQRMAALPCVYVAEHLIRHQPAITGAMTAVDVFGARGLLDQLSHDDVEICR